MPLGDLRQDQDGNYIALNVEQKSEHPKTFLEGRDVRRQNNYRQESTRRPLSSLLLFMRVKVRLGLFVNGVGVLVVRVARDPTAWPVLEWRVGLLRGNE